MYLQPLEGSLGPNALATPAGNADGEGGLLQGSPFAGSPGDNISRFVPPWQNASASAPYEGAPFGAPGSAQGAFGPLMGLLQQLVQMLQSMMGYGGGAPYGNGGCPPYGGGERYFQNANGSSEGDPHLSFNGEKWNAMGSQPNLLNSNSFAGGFRISTQATAPNAKGVTWNRSATVTLDNGATTVSLNSQGEPTVTSDGRQMAIERGQTLSLGNGESVTYQRNGSLLVTAENGQGGRIATTLSAQGNGVNVDVTAHDVDLGGALVNRYDHDRDRDPRPVPSPFGGPVPLPIEGPEPLPIQGPVSGPIIDPYPVSPLGVPQPAL